MMQFPCTHWSTLKVVYQEPEEDDGEEAEDGEEDEDAARVHDCAHEEQQAEESEQGWKRFKFKLDFNKKSIAHFSYMHAFSPWLLHFRRAYFCLTNLDNS